MKKLNFKEMPKLQKKSIAIAIALCFAAPVSAEEVDEEVKRLITPDSSISLGAGNVSKDNQLFGMYNGLSENGMVGLIDFSINRRDDDTGTWYRAYGRNVGLDNRELRAEHERQGQWGYFLDYNQITRNSPYTLQTNVKDIGTDNLKVPTGTTSSPIGASTEYKLKTQRQRTSLGANYVLPSNFELRVLFQNEDKQGARLFGRGTTGGVTPQEFLAEPIDTKTRQLDVVLDYTGEALQLSGGYYGSMFTNANPFLKVSGGNSGLSTAATTGVAMDNISLPPDNHAHQFHLAGGYQFAKTTRMNFKVAKSIAIQNDDFMPVNFYNTANNGVSANTSGRSNLGGRVDTTLINLGITSRPISNLSLLGNVRYEDRDDKTAIARYITNVTGTGARPVITPFSPNVTADKNGSTDGYNEPRSLTNRGAKLEASYLLPEGFRVIGGYDYDQKNRSTDGIRVVGYREETKDNTYRFEIKRTMAETMTGSLSYSHSKRDGSEYKNLTTLGNYSYPNYNSANLPCNRTNTTFNASSCGLIQPIYMADRERDKIRWMMDWSPLDALSAQFLAEGASDSYAPGRGTPDIGVRQGESQLYSLDVSYALSETWKLNGWLSRNQASISQSTIASPASNTTSVLWQSEQKNIVDTFGVGMRGKLPYAIDIGADYVFANDKTRYGMENTRYYNKTTGVTNLPDIRYLQQTLRMFGAHAYDKSTTIRLDYVYDKRHADDWTWSNWTYTDGTKIVQNPDQSVHFVGVSVNYKFQ
jgi:MtrB/PioB family decaheme-associated outer membrane protein